MHFFNKNSDFDARKIKIFLGALRAQTQRGRGKGGGTDQACAGILKRKGGVGEGGPGPPPSLPQTPSPLPPPLFHVVSGFWEIWPENFPGLRKIFLSATSAPGVM